MEETVADLRRQLQEERRAREEAELRLQPNTLFRLLDRCHHSLSQAIQVETDATLTTQGDATNPANRLYPKRIVPWLDFPNSKSKNIRNKPIYSEASLRNFERDTVDNFVEMIIEALRDDELRDEFQIQGRVIFYDRANPSEMSLENSLEQMNLQDVRTPQRLANTRHGRGRGTGKGATQRQTRAGTSRRRNRRADQFCVHTVANELQKPVYAVEFKAPHKVTIPELVAGLHEIDLARDVINQEGDSFEFHATRLVAAVITQVFSYMIDSGVQYGYICTGEAFVFLHIPTDPTVVQYFLCVPNQDVQAEDERRLHRTAIGQVLAFTLQALAADAPLQEWHDTARNLSTWEIEYLDVLRDIPETVRREPPASNYLPSKWKPYPKTHNTRSRARCQPELSTPKRSSSEGSGSDEESPSPSTTAAVRSRSSRDQGKKHQPTGGRGRTQSGRDSRKHRQTTRPYCTMACIRGIINREPLDKGCPNLQDHLQHSSDQRHSMGPQEFTRRLHRQLVRNRNEGFEPLHVCGRTGYLVKATMLSHGYTVVIKATTAEKQRVLQTEVDNYRHLRSLQGQQIPVCLGAFKPRVTYWYHGELMAQMMILSWSGIRLQRVVNDDNSGFFDKERKKALAVLRSHGVVHNDIEWRNTLWDELSGRMVIIDLEDVKWLKRPRALEPISGNTSRVHRAGAEKSRKRLPSSSTAVCT